MADERFDVLLPGVRVTLHARLCSEDGDFWEGFGHYVSGETGNVKGACKSFIINFNVQCLHFCVQVRSNTSSAVFQYVKMPVLVDHMMESSPWVCCGV